MKQKFRFAELYRKNKTAVEKTLSAMWCGEARNESQKGYISQLTKPERLHQSVDKAYSRGVCSQGCNAFGTVYEQL